MGLVEREFCGHGIQLQLYGVLKKLHTELKMF
jgi:hypothetical protein